jgi:DNA-binding GntR family transcriptional regulator
VSLALVPSEQAEQSMSERAYRVIRRLICTAELAPGSLISEASLVATLGIGRTPVREALRALAAEHLIDIYPRRGMFVAGVDPRNLRALGEVRERLEPFAASLAAQRRDDDDVVQIDQLLDALDALGPTVDSRTLIDLDERIHQCIYRCTHNPYLASDLDRYYAHAVRIWFLALPTIAHLQEAVVEHRELLDAVRCRDADRAATVMSKHVTEFEAEMSRAL